MGVVLEAFPWSCDHEPRRHKGLREWFNCVGNYGVDREELRRKKGDCVGYCVGRIFGMGFGRF